MELLDVQPGRVVDMADMPTALSKEQLVRQLPVATLGYHAHLDSLNETCRTEDLLVGASEAEIAEEFEEWFTPEVVAWAGIVKWADPTTRMTLVATPNVLAGPREICTAAKLFGHHRAVPTYVWDELYGRYTPQQLSGTEPDNGRNVQFSLFPSTYTPGMEGTALELQEKLALIRSITPHLKVPSVLSSLAYFETLRAQGYSFDGVSPEETSVCHIDLPSQRMGDWSRLPSTVMAHDGQLLLSYAGTMDINQTRLAIV